MTQTGALVLVVDDVGETRELYESWLREAGFSVDGAANGEEALDKVQRLEPAVVVMDLSMPGVDGWTATARIKSNPSTSRIVVIAVTGHGTHYGLRQAREAGADRVLTKPCLPGDLVGNVKALLDGRSSR